jgi:predicted 3-demethylubiquinone-9 3-methyltransferase (glyoxalase superfamily)
MTIAKNAICLWFDKAAARFYAATIPNSEVRSVYKAPGDYPNGRQRVRSPSRRLRNLQKTVNRSGVTDSRGSRTFE